MSVVQLIQFDKWEGAWQSCFIRDSGRNKYILMGLNVLQYINKKFKKMHCSISKVSLARC